MPPKKLYSKVRNPPAPARPGPKLAAPPPARQPHPPIHPTYVTHTTPPMQAPDEPYGGWRPPPTVFERLDGALPRPSVRDVLRHKNNDPIVAERLQQIHAKVDGVLDLANAIAHPQRELDALRESFFQEFNREAPAEFGDAPVSTHAS